MRFEQFTTHINDNIQNRFWIQSQSDTKTEMLELVPENIGDNKLVIRFCRQRSSVVLSRYWKTLLIVGITSDNLRDALQWTALCKEALLDPETSDVYLFIMWLDDSKSSIEECLRIEANEDFAEKLKRIEIEWMGLASNADRNTELGTKILKAAMDLKST